jgi:DNA-binding MarR family transcriptional regulator
MAVKRTALIEIDERKQIDASLRAFILFWQTTREVLKYVDYHLYHEAGTSTIQLVVLQALNRNNGVMTPSEISRWTQTERHNITTLVRRMKRDGLVTSERNGRNRKKVEIILTDKGREVLMHIMPVAQKIVDRVMMSIKPKDAARLERLLRLMRQDAHSGLEVVNNNPLHPKV